MVLDSTILPLYFTAITVLVLSPGPDLVLISSYSSAKGIKAGVMISMGVLTAGVLQTLLVAFGLGQLMQSVPFFAYAIKILGIVYLSYLGTQLILNWFNSTQQNLPAKEILEISYLHLIKKGFLNNLLNPKALLFFSLFLPQFVSDSSFISFQIFVLGMILSVYAFFLNSIFSYIFGKLGAYVGGRLQVGKHVDGFLGLVFLGLAARLGVSK